MGILGGGSRSSPPAGGGVKRATNLQKAGLGRHSLSEAFRALSFRFRSRYPKSIIRPNKRTRWSKLP